MNRDVKRLQVVCLICTFPHLNLGDLKTIFDKGDRGGLVILAALELVLTLTEVLGREPVLLLVYSDYVILLVIVQVP